jgi:hypothetical protein
MDFQAVRGKLFICFFVLSLLLVLPNVVLAANHYVRASTAGSGSGVDWTNAYTDLPANMVRGDTYYVAGGNYKGHTFNDAASGTAVITIKAATVADHGSDTGWSDNYVGEATFKSDAGGGIFVFNQPYYVIDGQYRNSDETSGYGFHANNYNGCTPVTSCAPAINTNAVINLNNHDVTIRYTDVEGSHDQRSNSCGSGHSCDEDVQDFANGNILIEYSYLHDAGEAGFKLRGSSTSNGSNGLVNFTLQYSYITRNWSQGGGLVHSEAMSTSDGVQNFVVRYNKFVDIRGTGVIATASGSCYNGCPYYNRGNGPWYIYGNQWWYSTPPVSYCDVGGFVSLWDVGFQGSIYVYNNTIAHVNSSVCSDGGSGGNASVNGQGLVQAHLGSNSLIVKNNIWYDSDGGVGITLADGTLVQDHNDTSASASLFTNDSAHDYHLVEHDTTFSSTSPFGDALSNVGSQTFNIDPDGNTRATWDLGAYELATSSGPLPPTGLSGAVH